MDRRPRARPAPAESATMLILYPSLYL